jgi:hypothetical protein
MDDQNTFSVALIPWVVLGLLILFLVYRFIAWLAKFITPTDRAGASRAKADQIKQNELRTVQCLCGAAVQQSGKFCSHCGREINPDGIEPPPLSQHVLEPAQARPKIAPPSSGISDLFGTMIQDVREVAARSKNYGFGRIILVTLGILFVCFVLTLGVTFLKTLMDASGGGVPKTSEPIIVLAYMIETPRPGEGYDQCVRVYKAGFTNTPVADAIGAVMSGTFNPEPKLVLTTDAGVPYQVTSAELTERLKNNPGRKISFELAKDSRASLDSDSRTVVSEVMNNFRDFELRDAQNHSNWLPQGWVTDEPAPGYSAPDCHSPLIPKIGAVYESSPAPATPQSLPNPQGIRWANVSFLTFKAGESADDTITHASTLGLSKVGDCKARKDATGYTDCEFSGSNDDSMKASFYSSQLQHIDYNFGIGRYGEMLGKIIKLNGKPRTLTDPKDSSYIESEEWGDSKEGFSISLGKTDDGKQGYVMFVLDPEHE